MDAAAKTRFEIMSRIQRGGVRYIELQFTDVEGMVKDIVIPAQEIDESLVKGIWFDGSSIEGFARVAESDMYLVPDPSTFAVLPWQKEAEATARLICDVYTPDGQSFGGDPRAALRRATGEAAKMGLEFATGPEMEFFLLRPGVDGVLIPPAPHDDAGYFDAPSEAVAELGRQMISALAAIGIEVEAMHHEVAGGQYEIDFRDSGAFATADNIVTFRVALKAIAKLNGFYGTFMPKPMAGMSGSGMHVHQGMRYAANGRDAFHDSGDPHGLSSLAKHFIAGQLAHARGACAILAPLVNSYKRLFAGYEAPVHISWARINRAALIRVPRAIETGNTRVELRCPDPSCNPYLAFAVMLSAGLDGIRRELPLAEANEENPYATQLPGYSSSEMLPISLNAAIDALEDDEVVCETLGPYIARRFIEAKRLEWEESHREVTPWELEKYLARY